MKTHEFSFINIVQLKDGSLAKYEGTEGSGEDAKVKIRRVVLRLATPLLADVETVSLDDIE